MEVLDVDATAGHRGSAADPWTTAIPLLRDTLVRIADEARHSMVVTDATGRVLWPDTRRAPDGRPRHCWSPAACPVHDPDAGAVIGAMDVTKPVRPVHPTTPALVAAAALLAEGLLAAQQAVRDELLLARNAPRLARPRGEPTALLALSGRVLASRPDGWLTGRVRIPGDHRIPFGDAGEAVLHPVPDGWLLHLRRPATGDASG